MQQWRPENAAMTFDEVSMERSKSFVKALQELKNLRPQLYSAAEYCEKSYLHNEQKQIPMLDVNHLLVGDKGPKVTRTIHSHLLPDSRKDKSANQWVLDNLKDYAVRALVNAVDHLGTVAYKLTDLFEQQTLDVSTVELKISCLNQRILTCQTYADREGLRQQQMLSTTPKHHKHYILPNSVNQKVQRNQLSRTQPKPCPHLPGTLASKTLSWHLASDADSTTNGASSATIGSGDFKASKLTSDVFHLLDPEASSLPLSIHLQSSSGSSTLQPFGVKDTLEVPKPLSSFRSFDNPCRDLIRAPVRSKSMLSIFFAKTKASKPKKTYVH